MQGKTVVITGATSGIGEVSAVALASLGARIVFVARNSGRGEAMIGRLRAANPAAEHDWVLGDLTALAAMHAVAEALAAKASVIDVLINNAGAIFSHREVTSDGLEKTFAVNHMAYFILTERLRGQINPAGGRIVSTSSGAHVWGKMDFEDLQSAGHYSSMAAYGRSKLANLLWTRELARQLEGTGVTANCLHPGGVATGFFNNNRGPLVWILNVMKVFMLTPEQGADTLTWLSSSGEVAGKSGGYWYKRKLTTPSASAQDADLAKRLWAESMRIAAGG